MFCYWTKLDHHSLGNTDWPSKSLMTTSNTQVQFAPIGILTTWWKTSSKLEKDIIYQKLHHSAYLIRSVDIVSDSTDGVYRTLPSTSIMGISTGWPKKVLMFDKSLKKGLLFDCLNIFKFWMSVYKLRLWHLNHSNKIKTLGDTPT